ncbi:MAG: NAD(P)-dependent oxidoreductase [Candidatus Ancillula sp.]|jgi:dTDP-6-deoxy-L-talose 4-dehydrogenase (NAD+)|nr:NAD(P)-dependent oxidoreductase [Candidatus Ancillula sp.]
MKSLSADGLTKQKLLKYDIMLSMRILITGAGGYIGRHVVRAALDEGHTVVASDINRKYIDSSVEFLDVDIFDASSSVFERAGKPDLLIHLAWRDGFIHNSSAHMLELSKHVQFINSMICAGLANLAVMGTMHEVGYYEGAICETTPCSPLSLYGVAKNALRQATLLTTQNVNIYWLRAFYIYGDDLFGSSIFSKIAQLGSSLRGSQTASFPFTTGKNKYDFIHVADLAKQIILASSQSSFALGDEITGIINVCSGKATSLSQQVENYIKDNNYNITLEYGVFNERPYDSPCIWGDSTKINKIMEARIRET